jgi:DNA modification methylase
MSAALASNAEEYHCRDVNPLVFGGYALQQMQLPSDCHASFEYRGSEIDAPQTNHYDLVFTSPPYYKIENIMETINLSGSTKHVMNGLRAFSFP